MVHVRIVHLTNDDDKGFVDRPCLSTRQHTMTGCTRCTCVTLLGRFKDYLIHEVVVQDVK